MRNAQASAGLSWQGSVTKVRFEPNLIIRRCAAKVWYCQE